MGRLEQEIHWSLGQKKVRCFFFSSPLLYLLINVKRGTINSFQEACRCLVDTSVRIHCSWDLGTGSIRSPQNCAQGRY